MKLIPALDGKLHRRDRWHTLGTLFDRPYGDEAPEDPPAPPVSTARRRLAWFPGLNRATRSRSRRFGR